MLLRIALLLLLSGSGPRSSDTSWSITITNASEPGEPLIVSGVVYRSDGVTPAAGAVLYVYHTDARGYYHAPELRDATPRLRGWMKTDSLGRYQFRTIRPASYPQGKVPAHIHASLRLPGGAEAWVDEYWFDGDPNLPQEEYGKHARDGRFSPILKLTRDRDGIWRSQRDLRSRDK
jgi:protocatechuate 3,4-dioxygenase beta subunit